MLSLWRHPEVLYEAFLRENTTTGLFFYINYAKISRIAKNELFMSFSPQQR